MSLTQFATDHVTVTSLEYDIESQGNVTDEPIVLLYCRTNDGDHREVRVHGFYPYFYITKEEYEREKKTIGNESRIRSIDTNPGKTDLYGTPVVKIETIVPSDVGTIRDYFDKTFEADIFFTNRFLIDTEVYLGAHIPSGETDITVDQIEPADPPRSDPRMCTVDIEVYTDGTFPEPEDADRPVNAITAHDSYTDQYVSWILRSDTWEHENPVWELPDGVTTDDIEIHVFDDEAELLGDWNNWLQETDPDILTGWNSSSNDKGSGFDYPYLINRCYEINEWTVQDIARGEEENPFVSERGTAVVPGRELFDMMQAYMKTQIHELDSYSLEFVSQEELGYGKEDLEDLDEGWLHNPVDFLKYNIRDVGAVIGIEKSKSVIEMYNHLRDLSGATYSDCADSNIGIIDVMFLREAKGQDLVLPTSVAPERGWYYGGKVFNPTPGKHRNVVYPDLASLYPYLMWSLNVSPETVYETVGEAEADGLTENDLYTAYIDKRKDSVKKNSSPVKSKIYYAKPSVKTGFVRDVVDKMVDMKYEYKSDEYSDERYDAVKRITNSTYGVFGDSDTYGSGFRLFDWRLAETITIAGQEVLKHTADTFVNQLHQIGYKDAMLVGGDTDSVMTSIESIDGSWDGYLSDDQIREYLARAAYPGDDIPPEPMWETIVAAMYASDKTDESYDEFMLDTFGVSDHKMAVEIESYADAIFFLRDFKSNDPEDGIKKKYAQTIMWDEGDVIEEPEPEPKGFQIVRSDSPLITRDAQKRVLEIILTRDEPREEVAEYLREVSESFPDLDLERIGKPSTISKHFDEYGKKNRRPMPWVCGARYATQNIDGENITPGSKPLFFYIDRVRGEYPEAFDSPTAEHEDTVNALSVEDVRNIPTEIYVDYEKMERKYLRKPVEPIVRTMGWNWDTMLSGQEQSGLASFM